MSRSRRSYTIGVVGFVLVVGLFLGGRVGFGVGYLAHTVRAVTGWFRVERIRRRLAGRVVRQTSSPAASGETAAAESAPQPLAILG